MTGSSRSNCRNSSASAISYWRRCSGSGMRNRWSTAAASLTPKRNASGDLNEMMNKTSCLSLLCNADVVWNTVRMQKIVEQLRASGQTVQDEDLARVWPLLHEHILPNS